MACRPFIKKAALSFILFLLPLFFVSTVPADTRETAKSVFVRAETLFEQKKYAEAQALYEKVLSLDPGYITAYRGLVRSYVRLGDPQGGVIFMEDRYLDDPQNAGVCYGLGYANYYLKKYDSAIRYFNEALQHDPNLAPAWNNCAAIYHHIKRDYQKAETYYRKAIAVSKKTGDDRVLAIARKNLENLPTPEEIKPLTETLSLEAFVNLFIARAEEGNDRGLKLLVLGQRENCEQAMDWFLDEAMQASAENSRRAEETALVLAELLEREYRQGFQSDLLLQKLNVYTGLSAEAKKNIFNGKTLLTEGAEKEQQGKLARAKENYQGALSFFRAAGDKKRAGMTLFYLGELYRKMKNPQAAKEAYLDSLTSFVETRDEPGKALVLSSLGIVCYQLGDYGEAVEFLKRSKTAYHRIGDPEAEQKVAKNIEQIKNKVKSK